MESSHVCSQSCCCWLIRTFGNDRYQSACILPIFTKICISRLHESFPHCVLPYTGYSYSQLWQLRRLNWGLAEFLFPHFRCSWISKYFLTSMFLCLIPPSLILKHLEIHSMPGFSVTVSQKSSPLALNCLHIILNYWSTHSPLAVQLISQSMPELRLYYYGFTLGNKDYMAQQNKRFIVGTVLRK